MRRIRASLWLLGAVLAVRPLRAQGDVTDLIRRAVEEQQKGNYADAADGYRAVLKQQPKDVATHVNLGVVLVHLEQFDDAIAEYNAAAKLLPGDPRIELNLALAYEKSGRLRESVAHLETLHQASPEDSQVTMLLADCHLQLGEDEQTIGLLEPLEVKASDNLGIAYMLGMALLHKQRIDEGQKQLDKILRNGDTAEARFLLGTRMFESADYPAAVKELASAIALNAQVPGLQSLYGRALLNTGDADGATGAFQRELARNSNDYEANLRLGQILTERKQYTDALPHLERAGKIRPNDPEVKLGLAECLAGSGELQRALPIARDVAAAMPRSAEVHTTLASIYEGLHRNADAAAERSAAKTIVQAREASADGPKVNERAPDFSLPEAGSNNMVSLRELEGRTPVVLIFGSYTCPNFRGAAPALKAMQQRYAGSARFLLVYIREAHDSSNWQSSRNERENVKLTAASTLAEKKSDAMLCSRKLHLPFAAVVDGMDGAVEAAYQAWPSRVYVVDADGKILYSSHLTELDFHANEMETVLARLARRDRMASR